MAYVATPNIGSSIHCSSQRARSPCSSSRAARRTQGSRPSISEGAPCSFARARPEYGRQRNQRICGRSTFAAAGRQTANGRAEATALELAVGGDEVVEGKRLDCDLRLEIVKTDASALVEIRILDRDAGFDADVDVRIEEEPVDEA